MNCSERIEYLETYHRDNINAKKARSYWRNQYRDISIQSIERDPVIFENGKCVYEKIRVTEKNGTNVSARYIRPAADGPFPLLLMFHDIERPCRGWFHMTRFIAMGWSVLAIQNSEQLTADGLTDDIVTDMNKHALTLTKAALMLPDVDCQCVSTWGEGFGGGLAIISAALSEQTVLCTCLNPLPADREDPLVSIESFTPMLRGYFLMGTGMMDEIADPEGQFAAFNDAECKKNHIVYPKFGHERINHFEDQHLKALEKYNKELL